jgi:DNA-directed RNA polymerase beta' subunit
MTHLLRELQNSDNLELVHEIQFSLFSHQDIKRGSVADILTPETYDSNIPKNNGLFDHNMGSIDSSIICPTDEKKAELCPGYFGKIDLALPVFNNHFITYVEKILKCVCFRCSNLLLDKSDPVVLKELEGKKGYNRFVSCIALCAKNKKCSFNGGCFVLQPTKYMRLSGAASIKDKNNIIQIHADFSQNALKDGKVLKTQNFTPLICYQIFKKIKDEDVDFLGLSHKFSRPEWMIITSLAVPPPSVRPSVRQSDNQRSEDDLTYALCNIVKTNKLLKQVLDNSNSTSKKIDDYQGFLQYLVATYMDNEIPGVPQNAQRSSFRALKAITQRLKGKEGRLRGNIMGKRVDYSARTVISVDPNINIDEYGVPQKIAMNLTFPEIVTRYNMKKMQSMVRNGPKTYPGAKTVSKTIEGHQRNISLKHVDVQQIADNLQIGDIVHRHLIDGDVCLFNRQPTLHRMSMMTHRIKILPFSTFRLNVLVCKPYNADFDGDEMNMHIPQSLQTAVELEQICLVPQHIISPGTSTPCIEIVQDTLLGAYLLTINDVKLRRDQVNNYMMFSKKFNGVLPEPAGIEHGSQYWTGKQLYSLILPDISISQIKNIKIIRGQITEGCLTMDSLGNSSAGLIKQIYNAYGTNTCNDFLNDTQKLITRWMADNSFTIGFGDSIVSKAQRKMIKEISNKCLDEAFDLIKRAQHGVYANNLDDAYKGTNLEFELLKILSKLTEEVKTYIFDNISKKNNFYQAGDKASGSKGKTTNIQQIMGCVGQQDIWGDRIQEGFTQRTLPHFTRNDVGPDAKGFCRNSFIEGLSPSEMFFHAMGGRTGTIDTAIKSVTGDTPIIIMEEGIVKHVNIGDWIDSILDKNKEKVQNLPEKEMELLELDYEAHIPTTDLDGNVSWGIIKNITRHDPGKELYEIKTSAGRKVIVTESHSLLIWNGKQFDRKSTPDVKLGDFVPVTAQLAEPPTMNMFFDVSKYLLKTKFLYGSEYIKAYNMVTEIMKTRKAMPANWWNDHNNKDFILPYKRVQSFMRSINEYEIIKDMKENYIYSYGKRNFNGIKDKFDFTDKNGLFLGLYIAEGNTDIKSGYVQITNSDDNILDFCKEWFEENNIKYKFDIKINKIGGTSKCIRGYSTMYAQLLQDIAGHGARNKFINPECLNAPKSFIQNLINGIFSGDGCITENSIQLGSSSFRLVNDINLCLSRFGIFGKITITRMKSNNLGTINMADINLLCIRSKWAKIFKENINLIDSAKNKKLKLLRTTELHRNYNQVNDTVLDAIIEINKIDISKYPKVYDLTIPSTLNFGLANGLHVVDTADSGYLSRKFIKAAEELMVNYDFTVRNSSGHIVQFGYGDDNFDPIKLEKVTRIELIEYDNKKMEDVYKFESYDDVLYFETFMTPEAVKEMMQDELYKDIMKTEYEQMLEYRNDLRYNYFSNTEAIGDINTYIPINLHRVIPSQLIKFNVESFHLSDLTPKHIIDTYNACMKDIIKYLPEKEGNWKLFKVIFKSFLATKRVIKEHRMSKATYDSIILLIREKMMGALVNPGELVGIIGAQTLGEISTQLTLNSVTYETEIIVRNSEKRIKKVQIGAFIEEEIKKSQKIEYMKDKDTTYAECLDYYEIPSCDEDGNTLWKRIEAVTKHPVINKDGTNTMLKITTEDEREVIATKAKSFLKLVNGKIIPFEGSELKVGDYLPVSTKQIDFTEVDKLDLRCILPPNEYVYGSELEKAKAVMHEHHWWMKHANKTFTLPHKRSDTVVQLASDRVRPERKTKSEIIDGYVYMLLSNTCEYRIPEVIDLDYNFGYLIGAYCAEGCMTKHQISISNNDANYFAPIIELCEKWNLTTKIYRNENKNKEGWTSQDIRIYSTVLSRILEIFCGKLSHNKFVSDKIVFSNKICLRGFLDAYIGGDGYIAIQEDRTKYIEVSSVSKKMLIDVQQILNIFDIHSKIKKYKKPETNNRGSLDIKQLYYMKVNNYQSQKLANILNMKIAYKQEGLAEVLDYNFKYEYNKAYLTVPNEIDGEIVFEERNNRFIDTIFDKIKSIEEVPNTTSYAFDLTVADTRNFTVYNSINLRDTFHLAGVGAGSLVITQGIPRLRELINVSKNPKERNMVIYLKDQYANNKENAKKIQSKFSYTQLKDILAKSEILYDNKAGLTDNVEDREFIKSYKEFAELFDIDNVDESCLSQWILRLSFDKESLMNRKISIQEIQESIKENFHNDQEIDCIYSDDSVNDVIMRLRIKQDSTGNFLEFMKDFEKQLIELPLRGVTNVKKVELSESNLIKYNNDGSLNPSKEWVLKTSGSNLLSILEHECVDVKRTITNDIIEFYEIFGIEATRELLYRELNKVYSEKGPNPRHIQMLSDIMTYRGKLMQIDRHGLNKNSEIGPIAKASFEEVMNIFTKAAVFAEKDNMKGVSSNILAGQFCKSGTNSFDILIDEDKMMEVIDIPSYNKADFVDTSETDIDTAFTNTFKSFEPTESVEDDDFTFGFGVEMNKQYVLDKVETSNIVLTDNSGNSNSTHINEPNFGKIDISNLDYGTQNEPNYDKVNIPNVEYSNEIDFNAINIEEPVYEKPSEPVKTKNIKVKKVKIVKK